jgi:hypothetical protein
MQGLVAVSHNPRILRFISPISLGYDTAVITDPSTESWLTVVMKIMSRGIFRICKIKEN